jgi:hypothetical protein
VRLDINPYYTEVFESQTAMALGFTTLEQWDVHVPLAWEFVLVQSPRRLGHRTFPRQLQFSADPSKPDFEGGACSVQKLVKGTKAYSRERVEKSTAIPNQHVPGVETPPS